MVEHQGGDQDRPTEDGEAAMSEEVLFHRRPTWACSNKSAIPSMAAAARSEAASVRSRPPVWLRKA
jgi:hypothetical protein